MQYLVSESGGVTDRDAAGENSMKIKNEKIYIWVRATIN
jgi:hypothetical protein